VLDGWGYVSGGQVSLFTNGIVEADANSHEYKALKCEQDESGSVVLELASIASRAGEAAQLSQELATNNPSAFIEQTLATLKAQGTRVQGPKIKLLRPAHLPDTDAETFALLASCFSYSPPYRFDWERLGLLASIIPNINARDPVGGGTILHLAARTLNRPAIKALIKRQDLDVLVLDHEGYLPSQRALAVDARSPIGHLLLRNEIEAARSCGLHYAREISRLPITPKNSSG
jgi:ankyrin repeat protein